MRFQNVFLLRKLQSTERYLSSCLCGQKKLQKCHFGYKETSNDSKQLKDDFQAVFRDKINLNRPGKVQIVFFEYKEV